MVKNKIGFIGAGAMGEALIRGLLNAGVSSENLMASDVQLERLNNIHQMYDIMTVEDNLFVWDNSDVVVLAVKPQIIKEVLLGLKREQEEPKREFLPLVISIAAGIPLAFIEDLLPVGVPVIRAMPNTPARVGYGATVLALGSFAKAEHEEQARAIFEAVGVVYTVSEDQMDGVTGLSGSGPAYGYIIIEALADAGVRVGLPRAVALGLAAQTIAGAAHMIMETGLHPGLLKDQVTSPGGTTIAGVQALEVGGIRGILMNAVMEAAARSRELGNK